MSGEIWVICTTKDCGFKRHGSNAQLLKKLHEENNIGHICKITDTPFETDEQANNYIKACIGNKLCSDLITKQKESNN